MKKISNTKEGINHHFYSLIVPENILISFEVDKIEEKEEVLKVYLTEKQGEIPMSEVDLVLNGYMNPIEIQSFPVQGKACYLYLSRRRWKKRGTNEDVYNQYKYATEGCKTTPEFGAFLKEINR